MHSFTRCNFIDFYRNTHKHTLTTRQRSQLSNTFSARVRMSESRVSPNQTTAGLRRPWQPVCSHLKHTHTHTYVVKTNKLMWEEQSIEREHVSPGQLLNRDVSIICVRVWSSVETICSKRSDVTRQQIFIMTPFPVWNYLKLTSRVTQLPFSVTYLFNSIQFSFIYPTTVWT